MDIKEENLCRLCFSYAETEFEVIDELTREMLDGLLLKMNLDVSENPIMCQNCSRAVKRSYIFKSMWNETDKTFAKNEDTFESTDEWKEETYIDESSSKCRFCTTPQVGNDVVSMEVLTNEPQFGEIWPIVLPRMKETTFKNSLICTHCTDNMQCYFNLVRSCWDTEDKINTYCQLKGTNSKGKINLSNVLENSISCAIEQQSMNQEPCNDFLKHEELHVKDEELGVNMGLVDLWGNLCEENDEIKMYKCEKCTFETKYTKSLRLHELTHKDRSEVEMYKCTTCPFETKHKSGLKRHTLIHKDSSEIKMFKCKTCPYKAKQKNYLKIHEIIHKDASEIEMYRCTSCVYETKRKKSLEDHMLTHKDSSEVEMYKCELCAYETKRKVNLKKHAIIHKDTSEVEMYKCAQCSYESKQKRNLKSHMLIHKDISEVQMHKCTLCIYKTKRKRDLQKHMRVH